MLVAQLGIAIGLSGMALTDPGTNLTQLALFALLALAVHARVPVATLRSMIYAYPTFWRGIGDALGQLG